MQNLVELDTVGSTNDHAKTLARNGYPHGTVVFAHEQTAGRGRQGNAWSSLSGNLFTTFILRPQLSAASTGQLSFVAAVALAETLRDILPPAATVGLKWPNDVFVNGRKVAGILLEAEADGVRPVSWVIVGIGVNITAAPEEAIALSELGVSIAARDLLAKLDEKMDALYGVWAQKGFEPIRNAWLEHAINVGKEIRVRLPKDDFRAKFVGIDKTGSLQIELADGTERLIASGEVFL